MPNTSILPNIEGEAGDSPKKFTNIDTEGFEFWWDGIPFGGCLPERVKITKKEILLSNGEKDYKTIYEILRLIEPGETLMFPKHIVNYAAMHLARKMRKREALEAFKGSEYDRQRSAVKIVDVNMEMELQKKIVAANFPQENVQPEPIQPPVSQPIPEPTPEPVQKQQKEVKKVKCDICGFEAASNLGLSSHKRFKHK